VKSEVCSLLGRAMRPHLRFPVLPICQFIHTLSIHVRHTPAVEGVLLELGICEGGLVSPCQVMPRPKPPCEQLTIGAGIEIFRFAPARGVMSLS